MKFLKFWFPAILYSVIIFCVSSVPHIKVPLADIEFDKFLHIVVYVPFGYLVGRGIDVTKPSASVKEILTLTVLVTVLFGLSDEYHQSFVPGRKFELFDLMADVIGGTVGGYFFTLRNRKIK